MRPHDRLHQIEAKAMSCRRAGAVEPDEAFDDAFAITLGDAGAVVDHRYRDRRLLFGYDNDTDMRTLRRVRLGIVEQVDEGLGQQLTVAGDRQPALDIAGQAAPPSATAGA